MLLSLRQRVRAEISLLSRRSGTRGIRVKRRTPDRTDFCGVQTQVCATHDVAVGTDAAEVFTLSPRRAGTDFPDLQRDPHISATVTLWTMLKRRKRCILAESTYSGGGHE